MFEKNKETQTTGMSNIRMQIRLDTIGNLKSSVGE